MADVLIVDYLEDFESYAVGTKPSTWYGSCEITASGVVKQDPNTLQNYVSQGLLVGTVNTGSINVVAPYPRLDAVLPISYDDLWSISFKMKVQALSGCMSSSTIQAPLTLVSIGSIDRNEQLRLQITPDGYLMAYPLKTNILANDCTWHYFKIEMWDSFFNVYIDNESSPIIQQAIPMFQPYWKGGDNRIAVTFPVDGLHQVIIDDFTFQTTATSPSDTYTRASCFSIRDGNNNPVPNAPVFLIPASITSNQVTDAYGRFSITDIPSNADVLFVRPDLTTALITKEDVALAKQRRLVSGADEFSNVCVDADGLGIAAARMYYIDTNNPAFYTDTDGKIARTSISTGYHVFVKTVNNESVYLDATLFS